MTAGDPDDATSALENIRSPERHRADLVTQGLLEAGLTAISATLNSRPRRAGDDYLLDVVWPSRNSIIAAYNRRLPPKDKVTYAVMTYRWRTMGDYYADLFAWALHPAQYRGHHSIANGSAPAVILGDDVEAAAYAVALQEMQSFLRSPVFRMKLLISAMKPVSPVFRPALDRFYTSASRWWSASYQAVLDAAGLQLRSELSMNVFAAHMTALAEGLALRYVARPHEFDEQVEELARVLALGALTLIHGATSDPADQRTLAEYLKQRFTR